MDTCVELFVIDDCSSESYSDVMEKYSNYANVTFFRNEKNLGLSASRNKGLSLSNGYYIAFLDDDDIWLPSKLDKQVSLLNRFAELVACSSNHTESESKKIVSSTKQIFRVNDLFGENLIGPPSKILVRESVLENIRFDESAKHAEDWDFYLQLLAKGSIYILDEPLIIYNTSHFGRMTTGFSSLSIQEIKAKANMTYKNKSLIGSKNFKNRMAYYYFAGFLKRSSKVKFFFSVVAEVGLKVAVTALFKMTLRVFKK